MRENGPRTSQAPHTPHMGSDPAAVAVRRLHHYNQSRGHHSWITLPTPLRWRIRTPTDIYIVRGQPPARLVDRFLRAEPLFFLFVCRAPAVSRHEPGGGCAEHDSSAAASRASLVIWSSRKGFDSRRPLRVASPLLIRCGPFLGTMRRVRMAHLMVLVDLKVPATGDRVRVRTCCLACAMQLARAHLTRHLRGDDAARRKRARYLESERGSGKLNLTPPVRYT